MARPNARSSHAVPTPQGGGIAVVAATLIGAWLGAALTSTGLSTIEWLALSVATVLLALTGAIDDIRGLGPAPRLLIQIVAVGLVIASLPDDFPIVPQLARPFERALLLLGGVWFVNLVNFMDGIDWMTVAEVVPVTAGVVLLGFTDADAAGHRGWSRSRCSARSSALRRSIGRSRGCFSATSAACRSDFCSAG